MVRVCYLCVGETIIRGRGRTGKGGDDDGGGGGRGGGGGFVVWNDNNDNDVRITTKI